ncbi:MAG TPA: chemotaxis protein CheX [Silvibacterium sp.]|nr:chemotaxis protein CheX [Silvibacterium sp.]
MTLVRRAPAQIDVFARCLDEAVEEVFHLMTGVHCLPVSECPVEEREMISAVIGLAGALSGICVLCSGEKVALRMAEILTGIATPRLNDTVKDAIGEICNMIAGAWKGRLPSLSSECMLSTPTIISGTNYQIHNQRPDFRIERFYSFNGNSFAFTVLSESVE